MNESDKITTKTIQAEEVVFREGDHGRHVYLILSGSVRIYKTVGGRRTLLTTLGSGDIFGEMGLVINAPRYATIIAAEETRLIMVSDKTFHNALLNDKLPIIKPLTKQLVLRLRRTEEQNHTQARKIEQLEAELTRSRELLKSCGTGNEREP